MAEALRVYCRYGLREDGRGEWVPDAEGCPAQLCRADAAAHEAACEHALEACPFAGCGVQRRRRDADAHDAEAAVAHARGEREARLRLEAFSRGLEVWQLRQDAEDMGCHHARLHSHARWPLICCLCLLLESRRAHDRFCLP
jgi:hypothetical protein